MRDEKLGFAVAQTYHNYRGSGFLSDSEGKLHRFLVEGGLGYVGRHSFGRHGYSLLAVVHDVFASDRGPLSHRCGQFDTWSDRDAPHCRAIESLEPALAHRLHRALY